MVVSGSKASVGVQVVEQTSEDWWRARSHVTGLEGYIPATFVAKLKSIEAES